MKMELRAMIRGRKKPIKDVLNFWVMPNAGFATRGVLEADIREFERANPGVQVRLVVHPWSLAWDRLMDVVKGRFVGPPPDVLQIGTTWVATLHHLGALARVPEGNGVLDEGGQSSYVWDPGVEETNGPALLCVPWFIDVRVLFYRKDVFDAAGVNPSQLDDWKGFYQACFTIQKHIRKAEAGSRIMAPLSIPGQKPAVLMHDLAPWIWGAGGDFCTEGCEQAELASDAALLGAEFYFDLINQGFMPVHGGALPQGNFFTGHCAMQFSGTWPVTSYLDPGNPLCRPEVAENAGVALFPAGPKGRFTFLGGSNLGVFSGTPQADLGWSLVRFLTQPERQMRHALGIGALTARLSDLERFFDGYPETRRIFSDSLGHARRLPHLIELASVEQIIYQLGNRVLSLIRADGYNHKVLEREIRSANSGIDAVLSLHGYARRNGEEAA